MSAKVETRGSKTSVALSSSERHALVLREPVTELEICLGPNAFLQVTDVRSPSRGVRENAVSRAELAEGSRLEFVGVSCGEGSMRHRFEVDLKGKEASVSLKGLSVLSGGAAVLNDTVVHHSAPGTVSRQVFKDILSGRAESGYSGLVHVHRGADKSDSNQLNRNLLLSDNAAARSEPQLKIDADDVKCSHGSSTGRLPDEEIFYLRSRGIDASSARSLLIYGFANEILKEIPSAEVRGELEARVRKELEESCAP